MLREYDKFALVTKYSCVVDWMDKTETDEREDDNFLRNHLTQIQN